MMKFLSLVIEIIERRNNAYEQKIKDYYDKKFGGRDWILSAYPDVFSH